MGKGITTALVADVAITQPLKEPLTDTEVMTTSEHAAVVDPLLIIPESPSSTNTADPALTLEQKIQQEQDRIRNAKQMLVKRMDNKGWLDDHLTNSLNRK
jgi:hypothetical protein